MSITVRPRRQADLPSLAQLLLAVHEADNYPTRLPPDPIAWLASPRIEQALVAERGGLVGHVSLASPAGDHAEQLWRQALGDEEMVVIKRLFVDPAHRREAIGRRLLEEAVSRAHSAGARPVLDVDAHSAGANHLYLAAGFEAVGELELVWSGEEEPFLARCYIGPPPAGATGRR